MNAIEIIGAVATMYISLACGFLMFTAGLENGINLRAIGGALVLPFIFWMPERWFQRSKPHGG